MKTLPIAAYAYVGDKEDPKTWKLPLWGEKGLCEVKCLEALSQLKESEIPKTDIPSVWSKICNGLKKRGVDLKEVKGGVANFSLTDIQIKEVVEEVDKFTAHVIVIRSGFNEGNRRHYPKEVLARDYKIFEDAKVFRNHQTVEEEEKRPEGAIENWVGTLCNVSFNEVEEYVEGDIIVHDSGMRTLLTNLKETKMLDQMGISIRAVGQAMRKVVEGVSTFVVESFQKCRSVDFVTEPGAGGRVLLYESLVESKSMKLKEQEDGTMEEELQAKIAELEAVIVALQEENAQLKAAKGNGDDPPDIEAVEKAVDEAIREVKEIRKINSKKNFRIALQEALQDSDLPKAAQKKLLEATQREVDTKRIKSLVEAEEKYILLLQEGANVNGLGLSKGKEHFKKANELILDLIESAKQDYMSDGDNEATALKRAKAFFGRV